MYQDGGNARLTPGTGVPGSAVCQIAGGKLVSMSGGCTAVDVRQFGADPTGAADSAASIENAAAFAASNNLALHIAGGIYKAGRAIAVTLPAGARGFSVEGDGADVTVLDFSNATDGLTINLPNTYSSFHVSKLTFATGAAGGGNGLTVNQAAATSTVYGPRSSLFQVKFRDFAGYATGNTHYWTKAIKLNGVAWVDIDNVLIQGANTVPYQTNGTCASLEGGTATMTPTIVNFRSFNCMMMGTGINVGAYYQGVTVDSGSNFVGGTDGVLVAAPVTGVFQINVNGAQFNMNEAAIKIASDATHQVADLQVTDALILVPSGATGILSTGGLFHPTIIGNSFEAISPGAGVGISAGNDTSGGIISGNTFDALGTAVSLVAGSKEWLVSANAFRGNTADVSNLGASTQGSDLPWIGYTPTLACGSGSLASATASGKYHVVGSTLSLQLTITVGASGLGTCASYVTATLPGPRFPVTAGTIVGRDTSATGINVIGQVQVGASVTGIVKYDGTLPVANNYNLVLSGQYEIAP